MLRSFTPYLASCILLASSCQKDADPSVALLKGHWKLDQIGDTYLAVSSYSYDFQSYIEFKANNSTQGLATCTEFTGEFTHDPAKQQLSFGALTLGTPTCTSPVMAARYLAALPTIVRYEVSDNQLRLYDAQNSKPQLVFKAD
jgi:hypothetical protein